MKADPKQKKGSDPFYIMSLLATAKANRLEPTQWLQDTLERLPTTKAKDLHRLLPLKDWQPV